MHHTYEYQSQRNIPISRCGLIRNRLRVRSTAARGSRHRRGDRRRLACFATGVLSATMSIDACRAWNAGRFARRRLDRGTRRLTRCASDQPCIRRHRMRLPGNHRIVNCTGRRKLICVAAAGDVIHTICCRRADGDGFQLGHDAERARARSRPDASEEYARHGDGRGAASCRTTC